LECSNNYFLKYFFVLKYIKIIFFYLKKIIFDINTSKRSKNTKKNEFKVNKKILKKIIFFKNIFETEKQTGCHVSIPSLSLFLSFFFF
jgi:hypothetical protein